MEMVFNETPLLGKRFVGEIVEECYKWWGNDNRWTKEKIEAFIQRMSEEHRLLTFSECDELTGFVTLEIIELLESLNITPMITNFYVMPKFRRRGYSRVMMSEAENVYRRRGEAEVYLTTNHKGFYVLKMGYTYVSSVLVEAHDSDRGSDRIYWKNFNL